MACSALNVSRPVPALGWWAALDVIMLMEHVTVSLGTLEQHVNRVGTRD